MSDDFWNESAGTINSPMGNSPSRNANGHVTKRGFCSINARKSFGCLQKCIAPPSPNGQRKRNMKLRCFWWRESGGNCKMPDAAAGAKGNISPREFNHQVNCGEFLLYSCCGPCEHFA